VSPEARPPVTDWASDFDHTDDQWVRDPFPIWDELRATCPVAHSDRYGGTWLPVRHEDVAAVAYYKVVDPIKAIVEIENVVSATYQIAQTTVRNIVGQSSLDDILSETLAINEKIKTILETSTEKWGIYVSTVEVKDIQLPDSMQRAMAKQAEAEREKRAKIIAAEGEALSAKKLGEAADVIAAHPIALQLRNLQVLTDVAQEKNSTIIFPSQFMDTIKSVKDFMNKEHN